MANRCEPGRSPDCTIKRDVPAEISKRSDFEGRQGPSYGGAGCRTIQCFTNGASTTQVVKLKVRDGQLREVF